MNRPRAHTEHPAKAGSWRHDVHGVVSSRRHGVMKSRRHHWRSDRARNIRAVLDCLPSPACGLPDHLWRVTAHPYATSRVRCLAGRGGLTAETNDGDSSAPERQLRYRRLAAVVWSKNLLAGVRAPKPTRLIHNRGARLEGTPPCGAIRRRHAFRSRDTDIFGVIAAPGRPPVDPARLLPQHRLQPARHAYASGSLRAVTLGFPCALRSDRDVNAEGAPPGPGRPNLSPKSTAQRFFVRMTANPLDERRRAGSTARAFACRKTGDRR
jgi:hypothetical protein